jgi:hypothetical protein
LPDIARRLTFAAGVLVILQVVVNTTKFFFHEVLWQEYLGVGPLQREEPLYCIPVMRQAAAVNFMLPDRMVSFDFP